MKESIFEIKHVENQPEEFTISEPAYNLKKKEDGVWEFTIRFETAEEIKRDEKLKNSLNPAHPHFEATAILAPDDLELKAGRIIIQKEGYDFDRDTNLSNLCYFYHESVEELEIEILEIDKDWIIIQAKGKAVVTGSNGGDPDAELIIHRTKFYLDNTLGRGIA